MLLHENLDHQRNLTFIYYLNARVQLYICELYIDTYIHACILQAEDPGRKVKNDKAIVDREKIRPSQIVNVGANLNRPVKKPQHLVTADMMGAGRRDIKVCLCWFVHAYIYLDYLAKF